jgi:hypothetical protein
MNCVKPQLEKVPAGTPFHANCGAGVLVGGALVAVGLRVGTLVGGRRVAVGAGVGVSVAVGVFVGVAV